MYTFYCYPKCSTCRAAKKWLTQHQVAFDDVDMITNVPSAETIKLWLDESQLPIRRLFNTSGNKYRELGLKDQIDSFDHQKASQVLATDGMLIKRPLIVKNNQVVALGFKEDQYEGLFA